MVRNRTLLKAFVFVPLVAVVACGPSDAQRAQSSVAATKRFACPAVRASIKQLVGPELPSPAREAGFVLPKKPTIFDVFVDAHGHPGQIRLVQSSGSLTMDKVAMRAAKETTYSPASRDCRYRADHLRFVEDWPKIQREMDQ